MSEYIEMVFWFAIFPPLIFPLVLVAVILFWSSILSLIDRSITLCVQSPPPSCDIDPRCHPSFAWAQDGSGWIGSVRVFAAKDSK